ncbi:uncharacterized protein LOC143361998 [Halictus rubicundus]|uniref:uncharacterized protein LOC143361998 n=1 Tax=Halictus rubicundus TaxID=77578 RepID=UPI004036CD2B
MMNETKECCVLLISLRLLRECIEGDVSTWGSLYSGDHLRIYIYNVHVCICREHQEAQIHTHAEEFILKTLLCIFASI